MSQEKYIGMDVHQATISVAVMDAGGKLIMECLLEAELLRGNQLHPVYHGGRGVRTLKELGRSYLPLPKMSPAS
jgi:hypothetical protein